MLTVIAVSSLSFSSSLYHVAGHVPGKMQIRAWGLLNFYWDSGSQMNKWEFQPSFTVSARRSLPSARVRDGHARTYQQLSSD